MHVFSFLQCTRYANRLYVRRHNFLVYLFIQRFFTSFGRIRPSSGCFYMYINLSFSTIPPYTGQCLHLEVRFYCPLW
jgi:hypothetical protein